ncbi:MAG TPA: NAD(P)-dependent oxidoreductase [Ktedonobacterales bacterium]
MILVTGGLGFIGLNAAQALLDRGETCVLTQHHSSRNVDYIRDEIGRRVFIEQMDVADQAAFIEIGKRHKITGIVHLAGANLGALDVLEDVRLNLLGLVNVLQAARAWGVPRVSIASSIGVYDVPDLPLREDMPLPMVGVQPIGTVKKTFELLSTLVASHTGFEIVNMRFSAIWGPLGRTNSRFFATPRLVHAAVNGEALAASSPQPPVYAEDGIDMCFVKDCGRAIALLQTAQKLRYPTYNVGAGRATSYREVVAAIKQVIPDAQIALAEGRNPNGPRENPYLDLARLHEDTGYQPAYDIERGVADYIGWLRAGNER